MEKFKNLGLSDQTLEALKKKGFTEPTTIQAKAIPLLLEGEKDVIGQSQTGTGKTASFALPILEMTQPQGFVQAIILAPTRELAIQVADEINSLKGEKKHKVLTVYGGAPIGPQREKLRAGVDIVVGTPGRVMDLQKRKSLKLNQIRYAVLDEADEMLNMGFVEDIEKILQVTPQDKSMLLFSATMPKPILKIAKTYMRDYELIEVEKTQVTTENVEQIYFDVNARDRFEALRRIIDYHVDFYGIVFCNTKAAVDTLVQQLSKKDYSAAALHGDITQSQREKILQVFKNKKVKILVATDVAARGIDVNDLSHVVNFSLPQSPEAYVHRIGRTGRAGKQGISITFVIPSERRKLKFVERINNCKLTKHELPSPKEIVAHKESQVKTILDDIITASAGKKSKYTSMTTELLQSYLPEEIIAAVLKYAFKNQLNETTYKEISEPSASSGGSGSSRSGRRRGGRGRSRSRSGRSRSSDKSRDGDSSRRSGRRRESRKIGSSSDSRAEKPKQDKKKGKRKSRSNKYPKGHNAGKKQKTGKNKSSRR